MNKELKMNNPPHPGEILKELYIETLGITITLFAAKIGVRRATASDLINGGILNGHIISSSILCETKW